MKKAVLLLGMVTIIAGCIYLKNADMDTVLFKQQAEDSTLYVTEYPIEYTEEISRIPEETIEQATEEETTAGILLKENAAAQNTSELKNTNAGGYAYARLKPSEQTVYVEIFKSLLNYEEATRLSTMDAAVIDKAFNCVMLDHPEIFYIDGYKYTEYTSNDKLEKIVFAGNYLYEETEKDRRLLEIEAAAEMILNNVPNTEDEYKVVKYLYDTLVNQTEYDIHAVDNQNICSVFLNGRSVCQGYAKALQYLLQKVDIESVLVLGKVTGGEGHAWNLVSVNGEWYYLDATWGDAFYLFGDSQDAVSSAEIGLINYDYLCVTTSQLEKTHSVNMPVAMPECTSMTDNYYVREGLYFTSFAEEDVKRVFEQAVINKEEAITIKCSDTGIYEEMSRILLDEQKIFEYLSTDEPVAFTDNKEQCSLTFWL